MSWNQNWSLPELLLPLAYIKMKTLLFLDLLTSLNYSLECVICNNSLTDNSDFYRLVQKRNNASLLTQVRSIQTYCTVYTTYKPLQRVLTNICSHLWGVPEVGINLTCIYTMHGRFIIVFYIYCSVYHNILWNNQQMRQCAVKFISLQVHSTCFGQHTRSSSGVQS